MIFRALNVCDTPNPTDARRPAIASKWFITRQPALSCEVTSAATCIGACGENSLETEPVWPRR